MILQELYDYLESLIPISEIPLTWDSTGYTSESFNEWANGNSFNEWEGERPTEDEVSIMAKLLRTKHGDSLLDVACGYGRHTFLFAGLYDLNVTGIDISNGLIEVARKSAREKGLKIDFQVKRGRDLPWQDKFDHAIIAFNSFSLFSPEDARIVLKNINKALKKNGRLFMDLDNKLFNCRYGTSYKDWRISNGLMFQEVYFHQDISVEVCRDIHFILGPDRMTDFISFKRIYSEDEIRDLFAKFGFHIEEIYGDWDLSPLTQDSPKMILVSAL
jgi:D-alanine-D-alanine ligase